MTENSGAAIYDNVAARFCGADCSQPLERFFLIQLNAQALSGF